MSEYSGLSSPEVTTGLVEPTVTDTSGVTEIDNSELRKIAEDVLNAVKYSFVSVAANPDQEVRPDSIEVSCKEAIKALEGRPARTAVPSVKDKAIELTQLSDVARREMFGRYSRMDTKSFLAQGFDRVHESLESADPLKINKKLLGIRMPTVTVPAGVLRETDAGLLIPGELVPAEFEAEYDWEEAVKAASESDVYNAIKQEEIWGPRYSTEPFEAEGFEEFEEQAVTDKLGFYVRKVRCVDETNPEKIGPFNWIHDKIDIAGVSVDETGDTKRISRRRVGNGFDDNEEKRYSPPWRYHWFSLREGGNNWPKYYSMTLILAEIDHGGFSNALNKIWNKIMKKVEKALKELVGNLSGIWAVIAKAVVDIVMWIIDKLIGWLIRVFKDDVFPPKTARLIVPGYNYRWPRGRTTSPRRRLHFYGFGGHYYVEYYWRMYA